LRVTFVCWRRRGARGAPARTTGSADAPVVSDWDPDIASVAESTLEAISRESISAALARAGASTELRMFFCKGGIKPGDVPAPDTDGLLEPVAEPEFLLAVDDERRQVSTLQKIASLNVAQRIGLAMKGTREERAILIRDPNKIVWPLR